MPGQVVDKVLSNEELWGARLDKLPGFSDAVKHKLMDMVERGVMETVVRMVNEEVKEI
jgi:mannitol-1-phosphate/altronate dehydrogenase